MVLTRFASRSKKLALAVSLGLLLIGSPALASAILADAAESAPAFPEFSQVAPYVTGLQKDAAALQGQLQPLVSIEQVEESLAEYDTRFQMLVETMASLGGVESWYADRVLDFDEQLRVLRQDVNQLQEELTAELERLEGYHQGWEERLGYLRAWEAQLRKQDTKLPENAFRQALEIVEQVVRQLDMVQMPLLELQQGVSNILGEVQQKRAELDAALRVVRTEIFSKNSHSFLVPEFYQQFTPALLAELNGGIRAALVVGNDFFSRFGWLIFCQLVLAIALPLLISKFHQQEKPPEEWAFLLQHPWATGIFVAVVALGGFYQAPPQLVRFALYVLGVGSVSILIAALAPSRRRALVVLCLAVLFLISTALRMISLPLPLYRVYLLTLYLLGAPLLWWVSVRARRFRGRVTKFVFVLRLGSLLVIVALAAQIIGYVNLSYRLVQASIETLFAFLFLLMVLKLGFGAIDFMLARSWLRRRRFIHQHGVQLGQRLKKLFRIVSITYALVLLAGIWGVFDTASDAWQALLDGSINLGAATITLRMVVLAGVTLYLTYQLSWFLQASIDTQLLQRRQVDRGVRDAIKKLLHYALVLIGFLLAISALGFQLQHLVVVAGAFGVGIGFGLQDIVNNFLSGLILLFERPVKVGDGILIDGEYGTVAKIGLRSTVVETLDQAELIVPNSQIISQKVTNWTLSTRRVRVVVPVGVAYGSDVELVMKILAEAGEQHDDVMADPPPSPIFTEFGDSSLNFELRVWIPNVDMRPRVKSELLLYIDRRFREEGVEIPFPQRDLHLRSVESALLGTLREQGEE